MSSLHCIVLNLLPEILPALLQKYTISWVNVLLTIHSGCNARLIFLALNSLLGCDNGICRDCHIHKASIRHSSDRTESLVTTWLPSYWPLINNHMN